MSVRWLPAILALSVLVVGCNRSANEEVDVSVDGTPIPPPSAAATATETAPPRTAGTLVLAATATPDPDTLDPNDLRGFTHPVAGACLPFTDLLMPNAPRVYRNGVHEGVDIYPGYACAHVELDTPILAVYRGTVLRADLDYVDLTRQQVEELAARTAAQGYSDPETLDLYRGRQVWIDHGSGVVSRYAHLASIAPGIEVGVRVEQGQHVGGMGESGTPESVLAPGTDIHLHYEIRIGDSFLGADLAPDVVRGLYERLFSDPSGEGAAGEPPPVLHVYTVQAGDTLQSIADEFGIGVEYVVWNNDAIPAADAAIEEGMLLRIPGVEGIVHRVAPGETLTLIAERYGANIGAIVNFASNGLSNPNLLQVGVTILVPGARLEAPAPAPTPEPTPDPTEATEEDDEGSE